MLGRERGQVGLMLVEMAALIATALLLTRTQAAAGAVQLVTPAHTLVGMAAQVS